jgi:Na+-translocating ferredoxin:NAD+ oxidoreductase subunit B
MADALTQRLHEALPQTQCTRCGYADCLAYAAAIADDSQAINRCPPGGQEGVRRLAALTSRPVLPLDLACGNEGERGVVHIDEAWCIGCTLCIKACPVDCIVGAPKRMHTVVEADCTGCMLCVPACPVDCIVQTTATPGRKGWDAWSAEQADAARAAYEARTARRARAPVEGQSVAAVTTTPPTSPTQRKQSLVQAAMDRAKRRQDAFPKP